MARFDIKLSGWIKGPMLVIGATSKRSYVELTEDELQIYLGRYHESVPRTHIVGAAPRDWPALYGLGVRVAPDAIGYVGSTKNVVQVQLSEPQKFRVIFNFKVERDAVALSLEDPEGFLEALGAS